jgi:predicted metal-binding membrane protein
MTNMNSTESGGSCCGVVAEHVLASDASSARASELAFLGAAAALFAASAVATVSWCGSMCSMCDLEMPGGWKLSMAWMRMAQQTWLGAAATFLGMWAVMMVAMMLPSLVPMMWRFRRSVGAASETSLARLTAIAGAGYFLVWFLLGAVLYPLGVALAALAQEHPTLARAAPFAIGVVVLLAGALQFSSWKLEHLACCRGRSTRHGSLPADVRTAWQHGLRLGLDCCSCCLGLTAILVVLGVMDLGVMTVVTAAITLERLAPAPVLASRAVGAVAVGAGVLLVARAAGLG